MITVKPAEPADIEAIARLAEERDRFYAETEIEPTEIRIRQVSEALFGATPYARAILAWDEGDLIGFASYSFMWPAVRLTRSLFLKELYVADRARGSGIGKLLMGHVYEIAIRHDCSRVEWTTDTENADARRFYAGLGVPVHESKLYYRVATDGLLPP
jgi:GNAT superfamily N-acetyltransferase